MKEIWKDIKGYENLYQVSNLGNIRSVYYNHSKVKILKILKPRNAGRYYKVALYKNGERKDAPIHKLVAMAFIENPNKFKCINHKDKNTYNNVVDNLEWCTQKYNARYSLAIAVLQYDINGNFIKKWECIKDASRELNINDTRISQCCKGKYGCKTAGGYIWKYKRKNDKGEIEYEDNNI